MLSRAVPTEGLSTNWTSPVLRTEGPLFPGATTGINPVTVGNTSTGPVVPLPASTPFNCQRVNVFGCDPATTKVPPKDEQADTVFAPASTAVPVPEWSLIRLPLPLTGPANMIVPVSSTRSVCPFVSIGLVMTTDEFALLTVKIC